MISVALRMFLIVQYCAGVRHLDFLQKKSGASNRAKRLITRP
jgi:hypothetical protein